MMSTLLLFQSCCRWWSGSGLKWGRFKEEGSPGEEQCINHVYGVFSYDLQKTCPLHPMNTVCFGKITRNGIYKK